MGGKAKLAGLALNGVKTLFTDTKTVGKEFITVMKSECDYGVKDTAEKLLKSGEAANKSAAKKMAKAEAKAARPSLLEAANTARKSVKENATDSYKHLRNAGIAVGGVELATQGGVHKAVAGTASGVATVGGAVQGATETLSNVNNAFDGYGSIPIAAISAFGLGSSNPVAKVAGVAGLAYSAIQFMQNASQHEGGLEGYLQDFVGNMKDLFSGNEVGTTAKENAESRENTVQNEPELAQLEVPDVTYASGGSYGMEY